MKAVASVLIGSIALMGTPVVAEGHHNRNQRIRKTQGRQMARIRQGERSGQLTAEESKELRTQQKEIRKERIEAKRDDGRIDEAERKALREKQKAASEDIRDAKRGEKHDNEEHSSENTP
jgi:hypothetical protein